MMTTRPDPTGSGPTGSGPTDPGPTDPGQTDPGPVVHRRGRSGRFVTPVFAVAIGVVMLVASGVHGDWRLGAGMLGIMTAYAVGLLLLGRRSETVGLLGGDVPDERGREITTRSVAFTGYVLVTVIVAMFLSALVRGADPSPWTALGAIGGLSFIAATAWYSHRS